MDSLSRVSPRRLNALDVRAAVNNHERAVDYSPLLLFDGGHEMCAQPCIRMNLMLSEVEFGVLTEVGEENTLSPEEVLRTILEEYVELRANHPHLYVQFAVCRNRFLR